MDHKAFAALLDRWQDGTLNAEEEETLLEHARTCPECKPTLEAAGVYKRVLMGFDREPVVPLEAQAAWRRAVREEKKRVSRKQLTRLVAAAAAVCLLMVGVMSAIRSGGSSIVRRVETDGIHEMDEIGESAANPASAYDEVSISVDSIEEATQPLEDIIAEYDGEVDFTEHGASEERIYVSFETADEDFLSALSGLGEVEKDAQASENVCVILQTK